MAVFTGNGRPRGRMQTPTPDVRGWLGYGMSEWSGFICVNDGRGRLSDSSWGLT
jgi:hypothetical protein